MLHGADGVSEAKRNGQEVLQAWTQPQPLSGHPVYWWVVYAKPHAKCWRDSE